MVIPKASSLTHRRVCCHQCKSEQFIPRGGDPKKIEGLFFDCSRCENGFCGDCFRSYDQTNNNTVSWLCFFCQQICRCSGQKTNQTSTPRKRKANFRLTTGSKKRRVQKQISRSPGTESAPSTPIATPPPPSTPPTPTTPTTPINTKTKPNTNANINLSLSANTISYPSSPQVMPQTPLSSRLTFSDPRTPTPKRSHSKKKKTGTQIHLSYYTKSFECMMEASDMSSDWVDPVKCNTPQIQKTLREMLRCLLLCVWRSMVTHIYSAPFLVPVKEAEAPDYSSIIARPMDLTTIRKKIDGFEYSYAGEMLEDVILMCENCRIYCTNRFPHLVPQANTVLDLCKESFTFLEPGLLNIASLMWPVGGEEGGGGEGKGGGGEGKGGEVGGEGMGKKGGEDDQGKEKGEEENGKKETMK